MESFSREDAERAMEDAEIFICIGDYICDQALIDKGSSLRIIGNMGSGYDNVDVAYAKTVSYTHLTGCQECFKL